MPLKRHSDDLTASDGVKFWMSDGERPVLCRVSHEALRDLANRAHFDGTPATDALWALTMPLADMVLTRRRQGKGRSLGARRFPSKFLWLLVEPR
ncbi:MAG: hypothetical protein WB662_17105, partial [Methyloceanibacter sp.]